MSIKVYPYKMGSQSARALAQALGCLRVREDSTTFRPRNRILINWGNPRYPAWGTTTHNWLNEPADVAGCSNKLTFLQMLQQAGLSDCIPEWTTDPATANQLGPVVCRTHLNASGGKGAHYWYPDRDVPVPVEIADHRVQLYTKYIKKAEEYRVHFGPLGIFHVQQKRKRHEQEADFRIRNHDNGWVFTIHDVHPPAVVTTVCERVIGALPLDFGALDVVYNRHYDRAYVLEVNTACGLEGTTLTKYVDMFQEVTR